MLNSQLKKPPQKKSSTFIELTIKRKIINHFRKVTRRCTTLSFDLMDNEGVEPYPKSNEPPLTDNQFYNQEQQEKLKKEIMAFKKQLSDFELDLKKLFDYSPKYLGVRKKAIEIAQILNQREDLKLFLFEKKRLPIRRLEKFVTLDSKTVERNKAYIIGITLILFGDFPFLKNYLKNILNP